MKDYKIVVFCKLDGEILEVESGLLGEYPSEKFCKRSMYHLGGYDYKIVEVDTDIF